MTKPTKEIPISAREQAANVIRASTLGYDSQRDLYDMYLEDVVEYSVPTALEKLETSIKDLTEDRDCALIEDKKDGKCVECEQRLDEAEMVKDKDVLLHDSVSGWAAWKKKPQESTEKVVNK